METIKEAKAHLRANFEKGVECPCCAQRVQQYKRKLNSGMALFLIGLWKLHNRQGLHRFHSSKDILSTMGLTATSLDYSVLKHFDLIEPRLAEQGKKDSGYWKMTLKGGAFTTLKIASPKHVFLYNNKRQGFSDETITIKEALGEKFDFDELMKG